MRRADPEGSGRRGDRPTRNRANPEGWRRRAFALLALVAGTSVPAQAAPPGGAGPALGDAARKLAVERLRRLDLPFTDWTMLRDVADKTAALGGRAQPIVAVEVELAREQPDPRYRVRLLGVQTRIDTEAAVDELERIVVAGDVELAALAARVMGRVGAPTGRIARLLRDRLARETRQPVRGALILAAGEAGVAESAPLLRVMLEKNSVEGQELLWTWTALAQTAGPDDVGDPASWLLPQSHFVGAAVLLARRYRWSEAERPLLRLHKEGVEQPVATWVLQSLGAIGGDVTREFLREAIASEDQRREAVPVVVNGLDPRRLALLRLGDEGARAWATDLVLRSDTLLPTGVGRLPELLGKWNVAGAAGLLAEWADKDLSPLVRASAARGLCWLRDARGLAASARLLKTEELKVEDATVMDGLRLAQQTLHQFVALEDRPDYLPFTVGDAKVPLDRGAEWYRWLAANSGAARWTTPPPDSTELRLWY